MFYINIKNVAHELLNTQAGTQQPFHKTKEAVIYAQSELC